MEDIYPSGPVVADLEKGSSPSEKGPAECEKENARLKSGPIRVNCIESAGA